MHVTIAIDTTTPLSDTDRAVLAALVGGSAEPKAEPASRRPRAAAKPAPAPEPEPQDEPADEEEDLITPEPQDEATLDFAVAKATDLVAAGKSPKVREALKAVGAKRVGELTDEQVPAFLKALG